MSHASFFNMVENLISKTKPAYHLYSVLKLNSQTERHRFSRSEPLFQYPDQTNSVQSRGFHRNESFPNGLSSTDETLMALDFQLFEFKNSHELIVTGCAPQREFVRHAPNRHLFYDRMQETADHIQDMIYLKSNGRYLFANKSFTDFCGLPLQNLILKSCNELSIHGEDSFFIQMGDEEDEGVAMNNKPKFISERSIVDKKGEKRFYDVAKVPFTTSSGSTSVLSILKENITS